MRCVVSLNVTVAAAGVSAALALLSPAQAASCSGNPNALGTSRVMTVTPAEFPRIGSTQYSHSLPLGDREVVLTFDDGPIRPFSDAVLRALAAECVKATFFMVGRQAEANPDLVRKTAQAGHTIGTHSQNHPLTFDQMTMDRVKAEIDDGIASVGHALGDARAVAPYFRIPGLLKTPQIESHLASRGIALWSTDFDADDWYRTATPQDIVRKAMSRLDTKGRGILLLHDVQPATAMAVPMLLRELKARGYRIVHAVPEAARPALVAERPVERQLQRPQPFQQQALPQQTLRPQDERPAPQIAVLPPPRPNAVNDTSFDRAWRTGSVRTTIQFADDGRGQRGLRQDRSSRGERNVRYERGTRSNLRTTTRVIRYEQPRQQQVRQQHARPRYSPTIKYPWTQQPPRVADRGWESFRR